MFGDAPLAFSGRLTATDVLLPIDGSVTSFADIHGSRPGSLRLRIGARRGQFVDPITLDSYCFPPSRFPSWRPRFTSGMPAGHHWMGETLPGRAGDASIWAKSSTFVPLFLRS